MSNEMQDEFSSWRSLLGSRDALPEHGLDSRDRSWEKLNRRLRSEPAAGSPEEPGTRGREEPGTRGPEEPRIRRRVIYWAAAACLLALLVPAALFLPADRRSPSRPAVTPDRRKPQPAPPAESGIVFRSNPPAGIPPAGTRPADGLFPSHPVNRWPRSGFGPSKHPTPRAPAPSPATTRDPAAATLASTLPSPAQGLPPTVVSPDSASKTVIAKQLRVVHINEIDNPGQSQPAMTSTFKHGGEPDIKIMILLKTRQ